MATLVLLDIKCKYNLKGDLQQPQNSNPPVVLNYAKLFSFCKARCLTVPENIGNDKLSHSQKVSVMTRSTVKLTNGIDFNKWFPAHSLLQFICSWSHSQA
jgi:hypothetical protein